MGFSPSTDVPVVFFCVCSLIPFFFTFYLWCVPGRSARSTGHPSPGTPGRFGGSESSFRSSRRVSSEETRRRRGGYAGQHSRLAATQLHPKVDEKNKKRANNGRWNAI